MLAVIQRRRVAHRLAVARRAALRIVPEALAASIRCSLCHRPVDVYRKLDQTWLNAVDQRFRHHHTHDCPEVPRCPAPC